MSRYFKVLFSPRMQPLILLFLAIVLTSLSLQLMERPEWFQYDRYRLHQGQVWLLLSGHMLHLSWAHFVMNMAGLLLGLVFFGRYYSARTWLGLVVFTMLFSGLALFLFNPELIYYVGMSGVLHGLLVAGAAMEYRHYRSSGVVLGLLLAAKLAWEQVSGALPGSASMAGGYVVVDVHLYGAIAGVVFVLGHQLIHVHNRHQDRQHDQ